VTGGVAFAYHYFFFLFQVFMCFSKEFSDCFLNISMEK